MRSGTNRLSAYLLGCVFLSLFLGASLLWARAHGRSYLIVSLLLAILAVPFVVAIKREINGLPRAFPPRVC
jgi:formate hydrogenlyase subunit 4